MGRATARMMDQAAVELRRDGWNVAEDFDMDDLAEDACHVVDPYNTLPFSERVRLANGVVRRLSMPS